MRFEKQFLQILLEQLWGLLCAACRVRRAWSNIAFGGQALPSEVADTAKDAWPLNSRRLSQGCVLPQEEAVLFWNSGLTGVRLDESPATSIGQQLHRHQKHAFQLRAVLDVRGLSSRPCGGELSPADSVFLAAHRQQHPLFVRGRLPVAPDAGNSVLSSASATPQTTTERLRWRAAGRRSVDSGIAVAGASSTTAPAGDLLQRNVHEIHADIRGVFC